MRIPSHVPMRSCAGCGSRAPQAEMVRFVAGPALDPERRRPGRGAYLHRSESCYETFVARKPPLRSLRRSVDRSARAALVEQLRHVVLR